MRSQWKVTSCCAAVLVCGFAAQNRLSARALGAQADGQPYVVPLALGSWQVVELIRRFYPPELRASGREADASVDVCISSRGKVQSATIQASSGDAYADSAALQVVRHMQFLPAFSKAGPVAACRGQAIAFFPGQLTRKRQDGPSIFWVVNGRHVTPAYLQTIDVRQITSVHVLKRKEATARFGRSAGDGAVILRTRGERR